MMHSFIDLALGNLISPVVLFFALGVFSALAKSELSIPEAVAKTLALYLMMSIGFKGGVEVAKSGVTPSLLGVMAVAIVVSASLPALGFFLLRTTTKLSVANAAAVAAHYGSISIVTFIAATQTLQSIGVTFEGYMIAVAAVMETPAIIMALYLASRSGGAAKMGKGLWREVALNSSVVMLVGSFLIGWATGEPGLKQVQPFLVDLFRGVLCLFLLDMGLIAGRGLRNGFRALSPPVLAFGIYMPLISASLAAVLCLVLGLSTGGAALFITLAASASYIAVPAAMRLALPEAQPSIYLTLSLAITFPFNLTIGIPLYLWLAEHVS
jgi:uncharacterized protein